MSCYATPCHATNCRATPCQWQSHTEIAERDLVYLAAASIAAPLLATRGETNVDEVADVAIRMAGELRNAQYRLDDARTDAKIKKGVEAENRHFRSTASKAALECHDRLREQYRLGPKVETQ